MAKRKAKEPATDVAESTTYTRNFQCNHCGGTSYTVKGQLASMDYIGTIDGRVYTKIIREWVICEGCDCNNVVMHYETADFSQLGIK
jgi:hypothetical protein